MNTVNKNVIAKLKGVSKLYSLGNNKSNYALNNVSMNIKMGDRIGIVGNNGAGKTTLLKIISGMTKPSSGVIKTNGKIVCLMELEAGFDLDLTGRENIMVNGLIIGMSRSEIQTKFNSIIDYSEIGEYIDQPFYTYSNGMKFRLAMSVALASEAQLYIIDEVIASGDLSFQSKVIKSIKSLQRNKKIATIACSHVPSTIWSLANTFYILDHGKLQISNIKNIQKLSIEHHIGWHKTYGTYGKIKKIRLSIGGEPL